MSLPVFSVAAIREAEADADAAGYSYAAMMEDAGRIVAEQAALLLADTPQPRLTLLIGKGNNGGDGLVAARVLTELLSGAQIRAYLLDRRDDDPLLQSALDRGVFVSYAADDHDGRVIRHLSGSADLIVDALFGIGVRLPIRDAPQRVLRYVRQGLNERARARRPRAVIDATAGGQIERPPRQYVLAVDCPSGVDCDSGEADRNALPADITVTFIAAKTGLLTFPAAGLTGKLLVAPLSMPESINLEKRTRPTLTDNETVRGLLPDRPLDGHKGTFGRVLIVAGSAAMPGAAGLAATAAYRGGAGLVEIATPADAIAALQAHLLEPVWTALPDTDGFIGAQALDLLRERFGAADSLVIGPGLGDPRQNGVIIQDALRVISTDFAALPVLLDADALNALALLPDWQQLLPQGAILTPHPAEMARLLQLPTASIQKDRLTVARQAAVDWQAIVVLKGAHTIVAAPDGRAAISPFRTDALGKGGTGDVLAGLIGALRAQGMSAFDAAQLGVYLHALAATLCVEATGYGGGVIASDVIAMLPRAFNRIQAG